MPNFRLSLVGVGLSIMAMASPDHVVAASPSLVGTWRLVRDQQVRPDGTATDLYGAHPLGQLIYDSAGHMSVHLLMPDLPKCGTQDRRKCPDSAARASFDNYLGYWGRYTVSADGRTVTHLIEGASASDWIGTSQERFFELSEGQLTLTTPLQLINGVQSKSVLVWQRE